MKLISCYRSKNIRFIFKYNIQNICFFNKKIIVSQKEIFFEKIKKYKINLFVI